MLKYFARDEFERCSVFLGASKTNFVILMLLTLGIIISYLPQYHRIRVKRTSEGLSTEFLLLGSCSSIFTLTNIILVSSKARACCVIGALDTFNCVSSQLSLLQIGVQSTCAILILVFVLVCTRYSITQDKEEYKRIVRVGNIVALHILILFIEIMIGLYGHNGERLMSIANVNGLLSTGLTMMKYIPQIFTTYRLKHPGTLSIGMMCIQTPGGALFTLTLMLTKGSHWSSWVSYFTAFILQGTLLTLCIYYEYFKDKGISAHARENEEISRRIEENTADNEEAANDLQTNLLSND